MKKLQRLMDKFTVYADTMRTEAQALRTAELYWVSRDMVDVVLEASKSLPEWTPQAAMPAAAGLLCWAKSAGTVASGVPTQEAIEMDLDNPGATARPLDHQIATIIDVPWDAVFWWTRPDGLLQLTPASRAEQNASVLRMARTTSPLWGAHTIMVRPDIPRTEEAQGTESAHPFVSALGAAWLLMAQTNVTETRTIGPPPEPRPRPGPAEDTNTPAPAPVHPGSRSSTYCGPRHRRAKRIPGAPTAIDLRYPGTGDSRRAAPTTASASPNTPTT